MRCINMLIAMFLTMPSYGFAATLRVPSQYPTIQQAIDDAKSGDVVKVSPGTYRENLAIINKSVSVVSSEGANVTKLDGGGSNRVLTILNPGWRPLEVKGFTFMNGAARDESSNPVAPGFGGGIYVESADIRISDDVFTSNVGCRGSALFVLLSDAKVVANRIVENTAEPRCAFEAVMVVGYRREGSAIEDNVVANHQTTGIILQAAGKVYVRHNIVRNNSGLYPTLMAETGGLGSVSTELVLENNLFANNVGISTGGIYAGASDRGVPITIRGNSFTGNVGTKDLTSALQVSGCTPNDFRVFENLFDVPENGLAIYCASTTSISKTNVFFTAPDRQMSAGCIEQ